MPIGIAGSGSITGASTINGLTMPTDAIAPGLVKITDQNFSGSSAVNVNNCFTSTYDNYRIIIRLTGSADNDMTFRLRTNGNDASGSDYQYETFTAASTTLTGTRAISQTSALFGRQNSTGTSHHIDISGPAIASWTTWINQSSYNGNSTLYISSGLHGLNISYDGITLLPVSGTVTGTLRIYGYRN